MFVISPSGRPAPKWDLDKEGRDDNEVQIRFFKMRLNCLSNDPPTPRDMLKWCKADVEEIGTPWLRPGFDEWVIDLDALRAAFADLSGLRWLRGKVSVRPEIAIREDDSSIYERQRRNRDGDPVVFGGESADFVATMELKVVPEAVKRAVMLSEAPLGIHHSLAHFRLDYPDPEQVAFIMMRFDASEAYGRILQGVKQVLGSAGITAVRADDRRYHDDLFNNVLTYMHGCGFGIAVFDRLDEQDFDSNVALEVGYMLAMQKPVCILKDLTLRTLQTDLMGKMYDEFDSRDPIVSIAKSVSAWLRDKKLA